MPITETMVSKRPPMDSITPMYDKEFRKKSSGRFETALFPNCGEVSCKCAKQNVIVLYTVNVNSFTSKIAKLVRWLHMQMTSVSFGLVLFLVIHPSDDHPP